MFGVLNLQIIEPLDYRSAPNNTVCATQLLLQIGRYFQVQKQLKDSSMKSLTGSKVVHHVRESRRQPPAGSHTEHSRSDLDATSDPSQSHISIQQNNIHVCTHISHTNGLTVINRVSTNPA